MSNSTNRKSLEKQFNYRKLTNENSVKVKPQRPPQPKIAREMNKEGILIDISPEEASNSVATVSRPESRNLSLIDEPIDVPQEGK